MAKRAAHVTEAELAVLEVLWERGPTNAREITDRLYPRGEPADVATVQKLLQRLEEKKFVDRDRSERVHRFSTVMTREAFAGEQQSGLAEKLSGGSLTPLLVHLVESKRLGKRELDELRSMFENHKRK